MSKAGALSKWLTKNKKVVKKKATDLTADALAKGKAAGAIAKSVGETYPKATGGAAAALAGGGAYAALSGDDDDKKKKKKKPDWAKKWDQDE